MIDEVLFMQMRLFRLFCERTGLSSREGNALWNDHDIWDFVESCYDVFHIEGDEAILNDIFTKLTHEGVAL